MKSMNIKRPELKDYVKGLTVTSLNQFFLDNPGFYNMIQSQDRFIDQVESENKEQIESIEYLLAGMKRTKMKAEETFIDTLYYLLIGAKKSKVDKVMRQFKEVKKELNKEIEDLKAQLNDDGEIPFVDIPVKTTKYKAKKIKKK